MKLQPDDPQVTAYALGELDPAQRAAVKTVSQNDPLLAEEVRALRETADLLSSALANEPAPELTPAQERAVLAQIRERGRERHGFLPWPCASMPRMAWAAVGAAVILLIALVLKPRQPEPGIQNTASRTDQVPEAPKIPEHRVQEQKTLPHGSTAPDTRIVEVPVPIGVPVPAHTGTTQVQVVTQRPVADPGVPEVVPPVVPDPDRVPQPPLQLTAIPMVLPAPTLKGTPEDLPSGPHIEPTNTAPRPPFLAPMGVRNLALGKKVSGSDARPFSGSYDQITDGEKEAFDDQVVEMRRNTQWVQVDLGAPARVYAIALWHDHRWLQVYRDVIVQVADDQDFTRNVRTLYNNDMDNSSGRGIGTDKEYFETEQGRLIDARETVARHVRAYSRGSNLSAINCLQEIEVYGLPVE